MSVTYPDNAIRPVLELTLPTSTPATSIVLTNNDTGDDLVLDLPTSYDGDNLTLDFAAGTIVDQDGADRSSLLRAGSDLWTPAPLAAGANDISIEAVVLSSTSSGPLSPGTLADDSGVGTLAWSNPSNAASSNNSYATAADSSGSIVLTHYLKATNFGFSLPAGAVVKGILAEVERKSSDPTNQMAGDNRVRIVKGGTIQSTQDKADKDDLPPSGGSDNWPAADAVKSYGGATDLWGLTWADTDIEASNFGVAIAAQIQAASPLTMTASIDHVKITVYYTVPASPAAYGATASWSWQRANA